MVFSVISEKEGSGKAGSNEVLPVGSINRDALDQVTVNLSFEMSQFTLNNIFTRVWLTLFASRPGSFIQH